MSKILKLIPKLLSTIILFLVSVLNCDAIEMSPYVGLNNQICRTCFNGQHGSNLFNKISTGFNPYFGLNFLDNFSLEFGYQHIKASRTVTLDAGGQLMGIPLPHAMAPATFESKFSIKGAHVDFLAYTNRYESLPLRFFGGIGASHTTVTFKRKCMQFSNYSRGLTRTFERTRTLRRITVGTELELNDNLSFRFSSIFINTKKLTSNSNDGLMSIEASKVIPRNTVCHSIGFKYSF